MSEPATGTGTEGGGAAPTAPPPAPPSPSRDREYVIFEQRQKDGPWNIIKRVTANDGDAALSSLGEDASPTSSYSAVADRYWQPKSPKVETQTTITWS